MLKIFEILWVLPVTYNKSTKKKEQFINGCITGSFK